MNFYISYCVEYNAVLSGIILENRQAIASTKDKTGAEVKTFIDSQIALIADTVIPYIIETDNGNLVAFFSLKITAGVATVLQLFIRNNFTDFQSAISQEISNFINHGNWRTDIL